MAVERPATTAVLWVILLGVGLLSVLPFIWVVAGSFKDESAIVDGHIWPWQSYSVRRPDAETGEMRRVTEHATLVNYEQVATKVSGLSTYYFNTIYLSVAGTFLTLVVGTLAAYGFARFKFTGSKALFGLFLLDRKSVV